MKTYDEPTGKTAVITLGVIEPVTKTTYLYGTILANLMNSLPPKKENYILKHYKKRSAAALERYEKKLHYLGPDKPSKLFKKVIEKFESDLTIYKEKLKVKINKMVDDFFDKYGA